MKPVDLLLPCAWLAITSLLPAQMSLSENFDSMGTSGTAAPAGWSFVSWPDGESDTWSGSIPGNEITGGTINPTLSAVTGPSTEKSATQGYNLALPEATADRSLGTSPTGTKGTALQWSITNTGAEVVHSVRVGYAIRRFTEPAFLNELPGYQLFHSLDGGATWTNDSALNPTTDGPGGVVVANSIGVTTISPTVISLGNPWNPGAVLLLRWVDDNDYESSPDQILGLDNVTLESFGSGSLTRAAYLQQAGPTTMTLRWRSSQAIAGRVNYGASPVFLNSSASESIARTDHEVTLTGLLPESTYFYSIGSDTDTLAGGDAAHTFKTPPVSGSTPDTRIWVLGDAGTGDANQASVRDAFYSWTGARDPDLVLQLGDNAYEEGTDSEFQEKVFDVYGPLMKRVPFWSCLGNHETADETAFVDTYPYFDMFTYPKAGECGGLPSGTEHYYSFDYGNIHFISLDSTTADRSPTGPMATWLANDLAANTRTWTICFFHHSPYTRGTYLDSDTDPTLREMRENMGPILEAGGADLVVTGHSHTYERSYLLDGHYSTAATLTPTMKKDPGDGRIAGDGAYQKPLTGPRDHFGTVYAVAGSAGKTGGGWLNHPAHVVSLDQLGSLVLDVNGNQLNATFVRTSDTLTDFTIIKQGAADHDGDGIPDEYEMANGLDRFDAADALLDADGDGIDNRAEFLFGLLASVPDRYQWTFALSPATGHFEVSFPTLAGRTYQIEWSSYPFGWENGSGEIPGDGGIKTWTDDGSVTGSPPGSSTKRFYRVRVSGTP